MRFIVTGSSGGIGLAIAEQLSRHDDNLILIVDRDAQRGRTTAEKLSSGGVSVTACAAALTDPAFGTSVISAARAAMGGVDAIVSAAGTIAPEGSMEALPLGDWYSSFSVNTTPTLLLAQAAFEDLKQSRGGIVAIGSAGASHPVPGLGGYSASKAALVMLIRQLALEWGPHGIRANTVSPGPTATAMAPAYADPAIRARRAATLPLRRINEVDDIVHAVDFLLGPGGRGITGQDLVIDNGMAVTTMQLSGANLGRGAE